MAFSAAKKQYALALVLCALAAIAALAATTKLFDSEMSDAPVILIATAASIAAACRQLPLQNVLLAASFAALIGGVAHGLSANPNLAMPFGLLTFNPNAGWKIFDAVPWIIPLLWIFSLLTSRGVARLILRPWRKQKNYGYSVIGLTAFLAVGFDLALEPFAAHVKHFWLWHPTKFPYAWHGASPLNFLGWFCITLLMLAFATPSLIKKQPGNSGGTEFFSVALWFGALVYFTAGAAAAGFWSAVILNGVISSSVAIFCWRGARW